MIPALLRASHFAPTLAVTAFTSALAVGAGRGAGTVTVAAAVLSGQLLVGWNNDYIDRARDARAGRTDKPIATGEVGARTVLIASVAAAGACVVLSLLAGWRAGVVHLVAVAVALAYNRWLKLSVLSVVPYVVSFGALPAFVSLGARGHPLPPGGSVIAAALLAAGAHFVNTLPDVRADAMTGVRGLPQRLGPTRSVIAGTTLLLSSAGLIAATSDRSLGPLGWLLTSIAAGTAIAVGWTAASGRMRLAWTLSLVTAASTVVLYLVRGERLA